MQAQLFCTGLSYCDFVVYTKKLHTERITHDNLFMKEIMIKVQHFFETAVLPELLVDDYHHHHLPIPFHWTQVPPYLR